MPNIYWYIGLSIIGIVSTAFAIFSRKHIHNVLTMIVFYFFASGAAWIGEFIVLGLFDSYAYHTGLYESPWAQNLLGHLLLNTTLYPATAVIMAAYTLGFSWVMLVAASFTIIDYLFVNHGLYEHHWWKYYMTFITVIIFLPLTNIAFTMLKNNSSKAMRTAIYFFVAMLIIHLPAPILLLLGKQYSQISFINNLFPDVYRAAIMINFTYHLAESAWLVYFTCILKKWRWAVLPFIISIVFQCAFYKYGILIIHDNWHFVYTLLIYEIFLLAFVLLERHTRTLSR